MATVSETVIKVISETLQVKENRVVPEAFLVKDLEADSLALVELAMNLEDAFSAGGKKFNIPDDDLYRIRTVKDICDYLIRRGIVTA